MLRIAEHMEGCGGGSGEGRLGLCVGPDCGGLGADPTTVAKLRGRRSIRRG